MHSYEKLGLSPLLALKPMNDEHLEVTKPEITVACLLPSLYNDEVKNPW